jgi:HK97 family phage portal protein
MNIFSKFLQKAFGRDFQEPNKLYESFSIGNSSYTYVDRNFTNFIEKGYVENPDVAAVTSRIASAFSSIKWEVKERKGDEIITNTTSSLNDLLKCPNPLQTWAQFQEAVAVMYLTTGNTYINGTEAVGFAGYGELSVLPSQSTSVIKGNSIEPVAGYLLNINKQQTFTKDEVLHVMRFDPRLNGYQNIVGLSPLESLLMVYAASSEKWEAMASILKNKGAMGIVTSKEGRGLTAENSKELEKLYKQRYGGGAKFGTPMFTNASLDFISMGMSAEDLKLMDQGIISLRAICNLYNVSSVLFNDPASSTYNNVTEAKKDFYTDAIVPLLNLFKENYNNWLVTPYAEAEGKDLFLDYSLENIPALQDDINKKAKTVTDLIKFGVISPNDGAEMLGFGRKEDTKLDEHYFFGTNEEVGGQENQNNLD